MKKNNTSPFATIPEALDALRAGQMLILVDDEARENEGDLIIAAEKITPDAINFLIREGRGLVCMPMEGDHLKRLQIPMMVERNRSRYNTAFTVSVGAIKGTTTGISAHDRAQTVKTLMDPRSTSNDISMPGHVFPLCAHPQGVLGRQGHTE